MVKLQHTRMGEFHLYLILVLFILVFLLLRRRNELKIPGPSGLPLIGNILQLDTKYPHIQFTEWGKIYGDIFHLTLLGKTVVVISGNHLIRNVLVQESRNFAGRPNLARAHIAHNGGFYISREDYSDRWKKLKRSVIQGLAMYGPGLCHLEEAMYKELSLFIEHLHDHCSIHKSFDILRYIQTLMANVDFTLICGRRMMEEEVTAFMDSEQKITPLISPVGPGYELDLLPWLQYFQNPVIRTLREVEKQNANIFEPVVQEKKSALRDRDSECECLVDKLLMKNDKCHPSEQLNDLDLRAVVEDLCTASVSTSSSLMYSLLALCVQYPKIQERIQAELDQQLGSRRPSLSDQKQLPYLQAVILELLRYVSAVPLSVPHKTIKSVTLKGYEIPSNTTILINLWSLHHDEKYWMNPFEFDPDRFLTESGRLVGPEHPNRKRLLPFGAGQRVCVGQTLAKTRIFLTISNLLQLYTFRPATDKSLPEVDPRIFKTGIVLYPPNFNLRVLKRSTTDQM